MVSLLAAIASPVFADDAPSNSDLDQRIRVLERQLEIQQENADAAAQKAAVVSAGPDGFSIKNAKGDYSLKFDGLIQADARFYTGDDATGTPGRLSDNFLLRRVEPTISGTLGQYVGFQITPEFGGNAPGLLDFWGELRFDPAANLRVGRFKEPVGLENLQSSPAVTFIERGLPTDLVPGRDIGVQLHGQFLDQRLSYAVGIFNGGADAGDATPPDADNRHDIAARVFAEPFKNSPGLLQNFGVGIAGTVGSDRGAANTAVIIGGYKTAGQQTFFTYNAATNANGRHSHLSPQAYWYHNNYGVLAEYVISRQQLVNGAQSGDVENQAYQVAVNYVLTGEDASYKGVKPKNAFKVGGDGWGAFEVALRTGGINIDGNAFADGFADTTKAANRAREYGAAFNWYVNSNAKVALNYEETHFDGGATAGDRQNERAILARLQVAF
ncbi:MAG: OprO/OprP family phosphate-selective porin [Stenotrophobium sp.]